MSARIIRKTIEISQLTWGCLTQFRSDWLRLLSIGGGLVTSALYRRRRITGYFFQEGNTARPPLALFFLLSVPYLQSLFCPWFTRLNILLQTLQSKTYIIYLFKYKIIKSIHICKVNDEKHGLILLLPTGLVSWKSRNAGPGEQAKKLSINNGRREGRMTGQDSSHNLLQIDRTFLWSWVSTVSFKHRPT